MPSSCSIIDILACEAFVCGQSLYCLLSNSGHGPLLCKLLNVIALFPLPRAAFWMQYPLIESLLWVQLSLSYLSMLSKTMLMTCPLKELDTKLSLTAVNTQSCRLTLSKVGCQMNFTLSCDWLPQFYRELFVKLYFSLSACLHKII